MFMNATNATASKKIWDGSRSIVGTLAETYLQARGLAPLARPPQCLRFAAKLKHPSEYYFPALIVQATDPETGAPIGGVQRTFLASKGGGKAQVAPKDQKMSLGPCKGGVARLAEPVDGEPLLIGEGVETVLTAMQATGLPGWATFGTAGLKALALPDRVKRVILLAENDGGPNKKALSGLIPTLIERGIRVAVATPPDGVKDFNDCVNGKSGHAPAVGFSMVKAAIEGAQDVDDTSAQWGVAEREIVAKLARGDGAAFLARAKSDPGFPFEPEVIAALKTFRKDRPADWQRLRSRLKADSKIHLLALEAALKAGDGGGGVGDGLPSRPIAFEDIEPWHEPVGGAALLTELSGAIGAYVIMDAHQRDACALGGVFSHSHDFRDNAPIFFVVSPERRCGKRRLLEVVERLARKPVTAASVTAAVLPRLIEKHHPTLLLDEWDALISKDPALAEALRGLLNASFDRSGAKALKLAPTPNEGWVEREFSLWTPVWNAGIDKANIPATVRERSVVIELKRKLRSEAVRRLRSGPNGELMALKRKIVRWVADNEARLRAIVPSELAAASDRAADVWDPLLAIADVAGGDWPKRARAAGLRLTQQEDAEATEDDIRLLLLTDIRAIFAAAFPQKYEDHEDDREKGPGRPDHGPRLTTKDLLAKLHALEERPWNAWGRSKKPMTDMALAARLKPYGVRSLNVQVDDDDGLPKIVKGYFLRSFEDAFTRYLPFSPLLSRSAARNAGKPGVSEENADARNSFSSGCENAAEAKDSGFSSGLAASKGGERGVGEKRERDRAKAAFAGGSTPPDVIVAAARERGVIFVLDPERTLFTLDWRGPHDPLIDAAIRDNYEGILAWLIREAEGEAPTDISGNAAGASQSAPAGWKPCRYECRDGCTAPHGVCVGPKPEKPNNRAPLR